MPGSQTIHTKENTAIPVGKYVSSLREHVIKYGRAWVEGELSEHTARGGHWYFTIADEVSTLKCVMWKSRTSSVDFIPEPGQLLRVYGGPTVYPKYGKLQFDALRMERRHTTGELQKRFLELKKQFAQEGLFDEQNKLPLPRIPEHIGIVTSAEGAALQDILRIIRDRFPSVNVIVASVRVQGPDAAPEISEAIRQFNRLSREKRPDLLIIGRGGGSLEDLWAFNEEIVARAIYESNLPIISAVGHETDTTIADLVADVRAATPTHAAQTAVPDRMSLAQNIHNCQQQMEHSVTAQIDAMRHRIRQITDSYTFNTPINRVRDAQQTLSSMIDLLHETCGLRIQHHRHQVELLQGKIKALDPNRILLRGYARIERDGRVVRYSRDMKCHDQISIHLSDGHREAIVCD